MKQAFKKVLSKTISRWQS